MKRILIVSDCPTLNTGYARVSRFVAETLAKNGYRVRYLPCNATVPNSVRKFLFELDGFDLKDRYNNHRIGNVLLAYKPALVMVFGEFYNIGYVGNICRQLNIKSLYYMPVEGENYPPALVHMSGGQIDFKLTLQKFHYIVAYSEFGKRNINRILPGIVTDVLPHQVDTSVFRPLDKKACVTQFFPDFVKDTTIGYEKTFIIGAVCRNMRRKGVDYILDGAGRFIRNYEKDWRTVLFLLIDPRDPQGYNLFTLIDRYGLKGRVTLHPVIGGKEGPEDNQLCEIYNTMDVHLCPFRAEGFGIAILESLACGVRTLCTDFASPAEFGKGVCDYIKPIGTEPLQITNCEWAVLNPDDVAAGLNMLATTGKTKTCFQAGVDMTSRFSNEAVARRWLVLLQDLNLPDMSEIEEPVQQANLNQEAALCQDYLSVLDG